MLRITNATGKRLFNGCDEIKGRNVRNKIEQDSSDVLQKEYKYPPQPTMFGKLDEDCEFDPDGDSGQSW